MGTDTGSRQSLYTDVTARIIAQLEEGRLPWVQPWDGANAAIGLPRNGATGRRYSGINVLILWDRLIEQRYGSQRWLTYRQALALGGHVRKGESGTTICYADRFTPKGREGDATGDDAKQRQIAFLKRFTVFNVEQCEGLPRELTTCILPLTERETIPRAEALIEATGADVRIGGDHAFYAPREDYIRVPPAEAYFDQINWYRTVLHELGHWTGHRSRLDRLPMRDDLPGYAREELCAEMCSAFLCAEMGIIPTVRHADYVGAWLATQTRDATNILVLDNATRITVNANVRRGLQKEGVVGLSEVRLQILAPAGLTSEGRRMARLYSKGQIVMFNRDVDHHGIVRQTEYAVIGIGRDVSGRDLVGLTDQQGRILHWDPRRTRASMVSVFNVQERSLATGDRIQWRLATKELGLRNAQRGTVEHMGGCLATIRWDRTGDRQEIDLSKYKTWDHGYAETVYSSQSKTYPRVFVLAPVESPLVTGQNFYTAITRAESSVMLWTESRADLVEKLKRYPGQKTSSLEGLDLVKRSGTQGRLEREAARIQRERDLYDVQRRELAVVRSERKSRERSAAPRGLAGAGLRAAETLSALVQRMLQNQPQPEIVQEREPERTNEAGRDRGRGR